MLKTLIITIAICSITGCAASGGRNSANVANGDYPFCNTYATMVEMQNALHYKDQNQYNALVQSSCMILPKGTPVSFIQNINGVDRVRVYGTDSTKSYVMYTYDGTK